MTDDKGTLTAALAEALSSVTGASPDARIRIEAALAALHAEGASRWGLALDPAAFARHLGAVAPDTAADGEDPDVVMKLIGGLHTSDLYLACACGHGVAGAVDAIETRFFAGLDPALRQMGAAPPMVEEIKQRVREALFVGPTPGILGYLGRGELRAWLRSVAVRQGLKLLREERRGGAPAEDALGSLADDADDPELEHLKTTYAGEFNRALVDALARLSPRERTVLKQSYLDGLSIDQISGLYRVHRATAARWIARARELLFDETRDLLIDRLQLTPSEFGSVARLVASQLDVSLTRLLAD